MLGYDSNEGCEKGWPFLFKYKGVWRDCGGENAFVQG